MKTKSNSFLRFLPIAIVLIISACSGVDNDYPDDFPDKWLLLSKAGDAMVIEEGTMGFDEINLKNKNGKLTEISISSGGGADQYKVLKVSLYEEKYYTLSFDETYNPLNLEVIHFYWEDKNQGVGVWQTGGKQTYVADESKNNFSVIAYEEEPYEEVEEASPGSSLTQKLVYVGAEFSNGSIFVKFKKSGGGTIEFDSQDLSDNTSIFYEVEPDADGLPIVTNLKEAVNQEFEITYHFEERENDNSGEMENLPVFDNLSSKESSDASMIKYFEELLVSVYNHTTEGLSKLDKAELLKSGESDGWGMITGKTMQLELYCKNASSNVIIALYPSEAKDLVAIGTINEQATFLTFWRRDSGQWEKLENEGVLPIINDEDFFDVSTGKNAPKTYTLNEKREIVASPNIWMNPDYEKLPIKYNILLSWNGESFSKKRIKADS